MKNAALQILIAAVFLPILALLNLFDFLPGLDRGAGLGWPIKFVSFGFSFLAEGAFSAARLAIDFAAIYALVLIAAVLSKRLKPELRFGKFLILLLLLVAILSFGVFNFVKLPSSMWFGALKKESVWPENQYGSKIIVEGWVTRNFKEWLPVDAGAYLLVLTQDGPEIFVDYALSDYPCLNEEVERIGLDIEVGQRIEAYGIVTDTDRISLCKSADSYLKALE